MRGPWLALLLCGCMERVEDGGVACVRRSGDDGVVASVLIAHHWGSSGKHTCAWEVDGGVLVLRSTLVHPTRGGADRLSLQEAACVQEVVPTGVTTLRFADVDAAVDDPDLVEGLCFEDDGTTPFGPTHEPVRRTWTPPDDDAPGSPG